MLGALWLLQQPLALIVSCAVVFSEVAKSRLPGVQSTCGNIICLCTGVLTPVLFAEMASRARTVLIDNANLPKKLSFPRIGLWFAPVIYRWHALPASVKRLILLNSLARLAEG